jgi:hypothetical protein
MSDSPQSKVGPNPVWFVATAKRRRTDLGGHIKGQPTQFAHGHNRAGKSEPNSVKQLPDGTTVLTLLQQDGIPVECFNEFTDFVLAHSDEIDEALATAFLHHQLNGTEVVQ